MYKLSKCCRDSKLAEVVQGLLNKHTGVLMIPTTAGYVLVAFWTLLVFFRHTHFNTLLGTPLVVPKLILERRLNGPLQNGLDLSITRTLLHDVFHVLVIHALLVQVRTGLFAWIQKVRRPRDFTSQHLDSIDDSSSLSSFPMPFSHDFPDTVTSPCTGSTQGRTLFPQCFG